MGVAVVISTTLPIFEKNRSRDDEQTIATEDGLVRESFNKLTQSRCCAEDNTACRAGDVDRLDRTERLERSPDAGSYRVDIVVCPEDPSQSPRARELWATA